MADHKLDENYDDKTLLRKWWPIVRANFTNLLSWLIGHINGTNDRHNAKDIDYADSTVEAGLDEIKEDLNSHTSNKNNPHSVTKAQVGLGNVDNTSDLNKPISTAMQTALNGKQATITGGASTITSSNLTVNRALISNSSGKVAVSDITNTELGYLDGVTSNIQTQLNTIDKARVKTYTNTDVNSITNSGIYNLIYDNNDMEDYNIPYQIVGMPSTVDVYGKTITLKLIVNTVRYESDEVDYDGLLFVPYEEYCCQMISTAKGLFYRTGYKKVGFPEEGGISFNFDEWKDFSTESVDVANEYTDAKIADLINGAPTTLDTLKEIADAITENESVVKALDSAIGNKVDKVSGKGLSTNDYTTTEKNKLAGIESGAQVNTITGVKGDSEGSYRTGNINITKSNIGLGNVNNTSDLNKPISIAMSTALDGKLNVIRYSSKDLNEITTNGIYMLTYRNTWHFDKSLYNLPDGYDTDTLDVYSGDHDMWLIVTAMTFTDDAPEDRIYEYHGAQFLYTKDGLFIREFEKPHQDELYYFNSWYNTKADIENHASKTSNPHRVTKEQVGLGNVENKSSATIRSEITKDNVTTALGYTPPEANIKKNPNATDGEIVDTHLTVGTRGTGDIGANSFTSGINNVASGIKSASIAGNNNTISGDNSVVVGGYYNTISGDNSVVVGGDYNTVNKYSSVVLGGNLNTASAERAAVIGGYYNTASGERAAVIGGDNNTASAERAAVIGGYYNTASGDYSVVCGGRYNTTLANQLKTGHYSKDGIAGSTGGTTGDAFIIGNGSSATDRSNAFRVAYDGNCYAATAMNSTGADYAECFEWTDGNPDNEDRIGFMTAFEGSKIRFANENDPVEIIGVVSAIPAIVGDNYADEWCGKYLKDKYGRLITEHKVYEAETDENDDIIREAYEADEYVLNPDYNADEEYIPRLKRKEYSAVGTHGKLAVRDDGTCEVGGFCRSGNGGIATKSDSGFYVMERIDDETVRIYIK